MTTVDVTITYDPDEGEPADVGLVLRTFAFCDALRLQSLNIEIALAPAGQGALPMPMTVGLMGTLTDLPVGVKAGMKISIKRDKYGAPDAVGKALRQIAESGAIALTKLAFSIPVENERAADELIADLELQLANRPLSVEVEYEKVAPGWFRRGSFARRTPLDDWAARQPDPAIDDRSEVTLTHIAPGQRSRTVVLTAETARNARGMLGANDREA